MKHFISFFVSFFSIVFFFFFIIHTFSQSYLGGNIENLSPLERLTAEKFFESKIPKESVSNCQIKLSQEPSTIPTSSSRMQTIQNDHNRNENLIDIPLSSKKDSKEDLRKYIKLVRMFIGMN